MTTAQAVSMGMEAALNRSQLSARVRPTVAKQYHPAYSSPRHFGDNIGLGRPLENLAHMRPHIIAGAFFMPAMSFYGGPCWDTFGCAGFQVSRSANPARSATLNCLAAIGGSSSIKLGAIPMHTPTRNPSALRNRAAAHRAMALAALSADSSLSVRLARYNAAMAKARALEAEAERQQTRNPRAALAWLKAGKSVHIDAVNLRDNLRHVRALVALEANGGEA